MKKSSSLTLTLLAAVASLAATSCRRTEVRDCVDQNRRIVDDRYCQQNNGTGYGGGYGGGGYMPYYWLYSGRSGGRIGDMVMGGATTPTAGARAVSGRSVSRGGFGHSFGIGG
jgi:uncharacterized protein YgiB involved in biofilm formation